MKNFSASFLTLLLALATLAAQAQTIRRVNNSGVTGVNLYTTIQAAHDAASAGDIIQVEPSTTSYGALNCTKQLSIVGPGYFLSLNQPPTLQASVIPATVDQIIFTAGSAGSSMSGLSISGNVYLGASNLSFTRNYMPGSYLYVNYSAASSNILVRQNWLYAISYNSASLATNNLLVTNNIIAYAVSLNVGNINGEFSNNVQLSNVAYFDNFTVKNNYFNTLSTTANTTWRYNLLGQSTLPTLGSQSNNTANVPQANVFVLGPGSTQYDAWYKLKTGTNPATGAGEGGVDIGAYGSATGYAYRLSGIPAIPAIYQLNQSVSGNTLNVSLSTRSNN